MADSAALPQYDAIRRRLKSQFADKQQQQTDAIQRRFAANGMVGSGAYGKAQDEAAREMAKQEADATAQLDFAEAGEQQRRQELEDQRRYQTSEREAGQAFNRGMFDEDLATKKDQFNRQFEEQRRQFQQEYDANQKANEVSAVANFVGEDIDDYDKVKLAKDWVNNLFKGDGSAPPPKAPQPVFYGNPFGFTSLPWSMRGF